MAKHGGKRNGSGRKPVTDKKMVVPAYIPTSHVEAVGGKKSAKTIAEQAVSRRAKNILKIS